MPRPIVLDSIKQREVRALLACGTSLRQAARYVGCAPATITNTAQRDTDFARQLEQARLDHDLSLLRDINRATARSWRAVIWALEHVQAEAFGGGRRVRGVASAHGRSGGARRKGSLKNRSLKKRIM